MDNDFTISKFKTNNNIEVKIIVGITLSTEWYCVIPDYLRS